MKPLDFSAHEIFAIDATQTASSRINNNELFMKYYNSKFMSYVIIKMTKFFGNKYDLNLSLE